MGFFKSVLKARRFDEKLSSIPGKWPTSGSSLQVHFHIYVKWKPNGIYQTELGKVMVIEKESCVASKWISANTFPVVNADEARILVYQRMEQEIMIRRYLSSISSLRLKMASQAQFPGPFNSIRNMRYLFDHADVVIFYLYVCDAGTQRGLDLYIVTRPNGNWQSPQEYGEESVNFQIMGFSSLPFCRLVRWNSFSLSFQSKRWDSDGMIFGFTIRHYIYIFFMILINYKDDI